LETVVAEMSCFTVSMANTGVNTNASQFFITYARQPHLDNQYTAIGRVIHGFDVLDAMEEGRLREAPPVRCASHQGRPPVCSACQRKEIQAVGAYGIEVYNYSRQPNCRLCSAVA
jgi:cyclophilin family peptidyl-prolyl cis-trans isomerase